MKKGDGRWRWLMVVALLLIAAILFAWKQGAAPEAEVAARGVAEKIHGGADADARDKAERAAARRKETVTLPMEMVGMIRCEVFDEESGNLTPAFVDLLRLSGEERRKLRPIIAAHLDAFGEIELANLKVHHDWGYPVITLKPCAMESAALGEKLVAALEPVIGPSRAEVVEILTSKQLREGGTYWVQLCITLRSDNLGFDFIRKIGTREESLSSHIQLIVPARNYQRFARWRHLDRIDPEQGK